MLKVLHPGFYSTIQDLGRFGFRDLGVPISGTMDQYSSTFANKLLGNNKNDAVIEMTMVGGRFQFLEPTVITISGAEMNPKLNELLIPQHKIIAVKANDILSLGKADDGFRTYLAVKGGLLTKPILESQSQYTPITSFGHLKKADILKYTLCRDEMNISNSNCVYDNSFLTTNNLEAFKGPEFNNLTETQKERLLTSNFKISKYNNRMAYQLDLIIENELKPILTSPVLPGTVQLTPKGKLIVLMRDCQTTGGYPRVLQLTEESINKLSQKTTNNVISIRLKVF